MARKHYEFKNEVALITRPRRFGKTLNMTMLREFFDISKDSQALFDGLKIMETEHANHINSMPVIYLTFKNCSGNSFEELEASLAEAMKEEYLRYAKLFGDLVDRKDDVYYAFFQIYEMLRENQVIDILLKNSLQILTKAASTFYQKNPLVLIDEYDHPLIKAHEKGFRKEFSELYGSFLGRALKGNEYLGHALVTGIQRVAKESIFSELNNFVVFTVLSESYSPFFGLTEVETRQILSYYGEELHEEVRSYYDGYVFAGINMYNPWSILYYLLERRLKPYWISTSTNALIKEAIQQADKDFSPTFETLIMDGEVEAVVNLEASFIELATTKTLWGLLINSGYLTVTTAHASNRMSLRIPNMEVKDEFRGIVSTYTRLNNDKLDALFDALIEQDMVEFLRIYQALVYEYISIYDIKENSYHMLFLGMAISVSGMYNIISNREAGDGRPDIVLESLQPDLRPHIIFEFKSGENVEKLKEEALNQIMSKKYYTALTGNVLCVGIAHNKKRCEIIHREIVAS